MRRNETSVTWTTIFLTRRISISNFIFSFLFSSFLWDHRKLGEKWDENYSTYSCTAIIIIVVIRFTNERHSSKFQAQDEGKYVSRRIWIAHQNDFKFSWWFFICLRTRKFQDEFRGSRAWIRISSILNFATFITSFSTLFHFFYFFFAYCTAHEEEIWALWFSDKCYFRVK